MLTRATKTPALQVQVLLPTDVPPQCFLWLIVEPLRSAEDRFPPHEHVPSWAATSSDWLTQEYTQSLLEGPSTLQSARGMP